MSTGASYEFRVWWTSWDPDGLFESTLIVYQDPRTARKGWEAASHFGWLRPGHTRATVSEVQTWQSFSGKPWFHVGRVDGTHDVNRLWPEGPALTAEQVDGALTPTT